MVRKRRRQSGRRERKGDSHHWWHTWGLLGRAAGPGVTHVGSAVGPAAPGPSAQAGRPSLAGGSVLSGTEAPGGQGLSLIHCNVPTASQSTWQHIFPKQTNKQTNHQNMPRKHADHWGFNTSHRGSQGCLSKGVQSEYKLNSITSVKT